MTKIYACNRPELEPFMMPERFRREVVYFMTPPDAPNAPKLGPSEYWIEPANAAEWLDSGVFTLISPLDAESISEIELSEDQERWLEWMVNNKIDIVRVQ